MYKAITECIIFANTKFVERFYFSGLDMTDEDNYPTDLALEIIERWHWTDINGLFDFIKEIWYYKNFGRHNDGDYVVDEGRLITMATGGWSGNESIMYALEKNRMVWNLTWQISKRGGYYEFIIPKGF